MPKGHVFNDAKERSEPLERVAMIMLEGFSETYLSRQHTPFLYELADQGSHATLEPMFAFRGIEATIFTGLYPNQHGIWTEFRVKESALEHYKKGERRRVDRRSFFLKLVDTFSNDRLGRVVRYGLQRILNRKNIQMTHLIPAEAINLFEPSLKAPIYSENILDTIPTLFDMLRVEGQNFTYIEPTLVRGYDALGKLEKAIKKHPNNLFWYVKLCEHDTVGHEYGPQSEEMKSCLIRLDKLIAKIAALLRKSFKDVSLLVLSAHGMCHVEGTINLQRQLKQLDVKAYRDYLVFLDSTMARFWFFNERAENEVSTVLQNVNHGHILSDSERKNLKVPDDRRYGELIFALDEGYVIHPNYFHVSQAPRGMHGYAYTSSPDGYSPLIVYSLKAPSLEGKLEYADVFKLLLRLLK